MLVGGGAVLYFLGTHEEAHRVLLPVLADVAVASLALHYPGLRLVIVS